MHEVRVAATCCLFIALQLFKPDQALDGVEARGETLVEGAAVRANPRNGAVMMAVFVRDASDLQIRRLNVLLPEETDKIVPLFEYENALHVEGIYTHLHSAFCSKKATHAQAEAFRTLLASLEERGCACGMAHMLNSAGLMRFPEYAMDGVRIGSAILGRGSARGKHGLQRVGYCEATVEELRWLPKGHTCGYGAGWKARQATRTAVLSVGWFHGFGCEMGNDLFRFRDCARSILHDLRNMIFGKALYVTVNGKKCRVLGHIGMLHTVVDVTKISCAVGDKAIIDINPLLLKGMEIVYR